MAQIKQAITNIVRQAIDIHFHIGPEIIPRKYTVADLIKAESEKIGGLVLKNHFYPTLPFIKEVTDQKGVQLFGGIVLNNAIGGLNAEAIYASALLSNKPLMIWFPTINAKKFLDNSTYELAPEWVNRADFAARKAKDVTPVLITKDGVLVPDVLPVLEAIKETKSVLATGHIDWKESVLLIEKALEIGITKIVVTHPIYQRVGMQVEVQKGLSARGVFMEQCYSMYTIDKIPIAQISEQIKQVGSKSVILSSDMGQTFSLAPSQALTKFAELLLDQGFSLAEIYQMMVINPQKLLGIDKNA